MVLLNKKKSCFHPPTPPVCALDRHQALEVSFPEVSFTLAAKLFATSQEEVQQDQDYDLRAQRAEIAQVVVIDRDGVDIHYGHYDSVKSQSQGYK